MNPLQFLDRDSEKQRIRSRLAQKHSSLVVVYGRRRCGKSRLLREVMSPGDIYYLADRQETVLQISALADQIARAIPDFNIPAYPTWRALFKTLGAQAPKGTTLVLDEFPYLAQLDPSLPSVLQGLVDSGLKHSVVLCGSSQRMMQGLVLDSSEPLYGRADEIINLAPLNLKWIEKALPAAGEKAIEAWSVWGGVPRYWELAREHRSLWDALKRTVFDRNGVLYDEPRRILIDDLGDTSQPSSILQCIAMGSHRLSEIAGRLNKNASSLSRPMQNLVDLGYIRREVPFGESPAKSKRTLYKLNDPFLLFWHRFVHPCKSLIELDLADEAIELCKKGIGRHVSEVWEDLCRRSTASMRIGGQQWFPASRWWSKASSKAQAEIDIVAQSLDKNTVLLGEVKWSGKTDYGRILYGLQQKAEVLGDLIGKRETVYAIFSKSAPASTLRGCSILGPEDVIQALG